MEGYVISLTKEQYEKVKKVLEIIDLEIEIEKMDEFVYVSGGGCAISRSNDIGRIESFINNNSIGKQQK